MGIESVDLIQQPPAPPDGTRRLYQHGCRCAACRAANARYQAHYRDAARQGRRLLGTRVDGTVALQALAALCEEGYRKQQIARWLGHRRPVLHWRAGSRVTLRTLWRLRWLQQRFT